MNLNSVCSLLFSQNPYIGFDYQQYSLDLAGWGSDDPNFEAMINYAEPSLIIEVGTWKGASAVHMASLLRKRALEAEIICIDTWLGGLEAWTDRADSRLYDSLKLKYGYPSIYYQFLANIMHCGYENVITPFPQTSLIAAEWLQLHSIKADLIYIDASHNEQDVYLDMVNYWDLLNSKGAMFGDDFDNWESVRRAVQRFSIENAIAYEVKGRHWIMYKDPSIIQ